MQERSVQIISFTIFGCVQFFISFYALATQDRLCTTVLLDSASKSGSLVRVITEPLGRVVFGFIEGIGASDTKIFDLVELNGSLTRYGDVGELREIEIYSRKSQGISDFLSFNLRDGLRGFEATVNRQNGKYEVIFGKVVKHNISGISVMKVDGTQEFISYDDLKIDQNNTINVLFDHVPYLRYLGIIQSHDRPGHELPLEFEVSADDGSNKRIIGKITAITDTETEQLKSKVYLGKLTSTSVQQIFRRPEELKVLLRTDHSPYFESISVTHIQAIRRGPKIILYPKDNSRSDRNR